MDTATPEGAPPWRFGDEKFKKNSHSAMPQRGLKAGVLFKEDDFHGSGLNQIHSCPFLQSRDCAVAGPFCFF